MLSTEGVALEDDFFIVCPSNTPTLTGTVKNRTSIYSIPLPKALDFSQTRDEYVCGLSEIQYPFSWNESIKIERCMYQIGIADLQQPEQPAILHNACIDKKEMARKQASTVFSLEELLDALNDRKPLEWSHGYFGVTNSGNVYVRLKEGEAILLDKYLAELLGFDKTKYFHVDGKPFYAKKSIGKDKKTVGKSDIQPDFGTVADDKKELATIPEVEMETNLPFQPGDFIETPDIYEKTAVQESSEFEGFLRDESSKNVNKGELFFRVVAERKSDLHVHLSSLFIYCDLVKPTLVGNTFVPLLRAVPIEEQPDRVYDTKKYHRYLSKLFDRIRYRPLSSKFFQEISFQICDDVGELVDFQWGKVVCTLHFKKRKQ